MSKYLTHIGILLLMPLLALGHGDKNPFSFSGVVSNGDQPISGAIISLEKNGQVIQSTETDENGNFELKVEPYISRMDQLKITVRKKGYKQKKLTPVELNKDQLIELQRQAPIPIIKPVGGGPALSI